MENEIRHYEIFCTACDTYLHPIHDKTNAEIIARDHELFKHQAKKVCSVEPIVISD